MNDHNPIKKYEPIKIPSRSQQPGEKIPPPATPPITSVQLSDGMYYEIEYNTSPIPHVGKFVLKQPKTERLAQHVQDEQRALFHKMRDIARAYRPLLDYSRFFDARVQQDKAVIFYKQAQFMKDFTDNYTEFCSFSQYFPLYQMMSYEQLRTYFTWRTAVRAGHIANTSLSYAFVYIYELLSNIGAENPMDGLTKLVSFWKSFRLYDQSIDNYMLPWLKDYHIYYELPHSFKAFTDEHSLTQHYPKLADPSDRFHLFCALSKYDIQKSNFYTSENETLLADCFAFVVDRLKQTLSDHAIDFDSTLFQPTKKMAEWKPFKGALFYPYCKQTDRRVVLSENEVYICKQNKWLISKTLTSESGRQLIGYMLKQMESDLRRLTQFKFKLTANSSTLSHELIAKLTAAGLCLPSIISDAVAAFYKESTKTVVNVDLGALTRIRQEALSTQEKLVVEEQPDMIAFSVPTPVLTPTPVSAPIQNSLSAGVSNDWATFKSALTETELTALARIAQGETDLKPYADACGMMLEVLIDSINEKAADHIGDNLIDEEFSLYEDYKKQVKDLIT